MKNNITKEDYLKALKPLTELENGWDGYYGVAVSEKAVNALASFLSSLQFVPGSDGSVQVECHRYGFDLEIDFDSEGEMDEISMNVIPHNVDEGDNNE